MNFLPVDGLAHAGVLTVYIEPGKGVWFGTFGGVSFLDFGGSPLSRADDVWMTYDTSDGLADPWVASIAIDASGRKWFGTYNDVSCLDDGGTPLFKGDDRWMTFPVAVHPQWVNIVESIGIDQTGGKWFGTSQTGIYFLDDGGTPFDRSDDSGFYSGESNGLASNHVSLGPSITIDSANGKWVCTSGGLCYLP